MRISAHRWLGSYSDRHYPNEADSMRRELSPAWYLEDEIVAIEASIISELKQTGHIAPGPIFEPVHDIKTGNWKKRDWLPGGAAARARVDQRLSEEEAE